MRTSIALVVGLTAGLFACGNAAPVGHKVARPTFDWASADLVPGKILVDLKDNVSNSDVKDIENKFGVSFSEANEVAHEYRYEEATVNAADEEGLLESLQGDSRVEHAEPMIKVHALDYVPNDPMYKDQYGLTRIGTESSWGMSCGQGVKVAIIDTGVQCYGDDRISDLAQCSGGYDFVRNHEGEARDENGHGSFCASEVAELTNNGIGAAGIAPCAIIVPVRVLDAGGSGSMESVAEGIRWGADHADVLSLSLGAHSPSGVVKDAVDYAYSKGKVIVAANGNSGGSIGWPAAYDHVIAVSATDKNDKIAEFSSRGPQTAIAAPGVDIIQGTYLDGQEVYPKFSGTSMSTPMVSAAAALLVSQGVSDPDAVREKLQSTADPKDNKNLYGAGILNASAAVRSTIFSHTIYRLLALIGVIFFMRKVVKDQWKNKLSLLGIVVGAFGAVPLFFTGLLPRMGMFRIIGELIARPIGEMDIVLGHGHSLLFLASAMPTVLASLLLLGHNKLKFFAGGLGLGAMALQTQIAYSNDTRFFFGGSLGMRIFMIASIFVSAYCVKNIFMTKATT